MGCKTLTTEKNGSEVKTISERQEMSFVYILSNCCAFFSNKTGNRLYRKSFKNNMQTCGVIKNRPVRDTVSKEPVEVRV